MKTTVEISDSLLDDVREVASREKTTVKALIDEGLRRILEDRKKSRSFKLRNATFGGRGLHPDAGDGSWPRIRDLIYKGRGA